HIPQNQKLLPKQNFNYSVTASDKLLPKNANDRLTACQVLHDTLLQIDEEAYNNIETDQTNEEFKRLSIITGDYEKSIIFREQNMGPALKRRAVAVHNAKVSKFHPDNELLEKEFDKHEQFKFVLCSLTKFLIDDKPDNKDKKKNTRTDWLRNKQIIVYNRSEIDDYLSNTFKQILYQVEERGDIQNGRIKLRISVYKYRTVEMKELLMNFGETDYMIGIKNGRIRPKMLNNQQNQLMALLIGFVQPEFHGSDKDYEDFVDRFISYITLAGELQNVLDNSGIGATIAHIRGANAAAITGAVASFPNVPLGLSDWTIAGGHPTNAVLVAPNARRGVPIILAEM
ncbi:43440_t:CDS:2, partial [Gigaspora margarita]